MANTITSRLNDIINQIESIQEHAYSQDVRSICHELIVSVSNLQAQINVVESNEAQNQVMALEQELKAFIEKHHRVKDEEK